MFVVCSCCGVTIPNEENVDKDVIPYPHDTGMGMCKECGGDSQAKTFRKRLGWGMCCFYDARVPIIREALSPENQAKWDRLSYVTKVNFIARQIEQGRMI